LTEYYKQNTFKYKASRLKAGSDWVSGLKQLVGTFGKRQKTTKM